MRSPLTLRGQVEFLGGVLVLTLLCLLFWMLAPWFAGASELRWQQREPPPVDGWEAWGNGTPRATILPTQCIRESVTPLATPWPTTIPGSPTPIVSQWSKEVPDIRGGELAQLRAQNIGGTSGFSNSKFLATETATPTLTATPSPSPTMSTTLSPTITSSQTPTESATRTQSSTAVPTPSQKPNHPSVPFLM